MCECEAVLLLFFSVLEMVFVNVGGELREGEDTWREEGSLIHYWDFYFWTEIHYWDLGNWEDEL